MSLQDRFDDLLVRTAAELYQDHRDRMDRPNLIPTPNVIDHADLVLFFEGLQAGLIRLERGGKFNTLDRPMPGGRWSLLSRSRDGGWYNAEYLPQLAAYVELVRHLGYPPDRVLFELPPASLQLDLAVLTDQGTVTILGEAKRAAGMLDPLIHAVRQRFSRTQPGEQTRRRGDEARQLAWRLWLTRTPYLWLVGPGVRHAYRCTVDNQLQVDPIPSLPSAGELGLAHRPATQLSPPTLR
jgi:hypothetical protein